jgi:hypothetical protein
MATLTIRIPEGKAERLKTLAEKRGVSVNKLMEELATFAIAEFDVESRFRLRAARGSRERGKAFLAELSQHYERESAGASLHDVPQEPFGK